MTLQMFKSNVWANSLKLKCRIKFQEIPLIVGHSINRQMSKQFLILAYDLRSAIPKLTESRNIIMRLNYFFFILCKTCSMIINFGTSNWSIQFYHKLTCQKKKLEQHYFNSYRHLVINISWNCVKVFTHQHTSHQSFFPEGDKGPPGGKNFAHPPTQPCPHFLTRACLPPNSVSYPKISKILPHFSLNFWLLFSSKLHQKALSYA